MGYEAAERRWQTGERFRKERRKGEKKQVQASKITEAQEMFALRKALWWGRGPLDV